MSNERMTRGQALDWMIANPNRELVGSDGYRYWRSNGTTIRKKLGVGQYRVDISVVEGVYWSTVDKRKPPEVPPGWVWLFDNNGAPTGITSPSGRSWLVFLDNKEADDRSQAARETSAAISFLTEEFDSRTGWGK
jgi:hypothetical protein